MEMINSIIQEFEHEAQTTRRHFERLPDDKLGWRPHQKSYTAGELASHIIECIRWSDSIFSLDEFVFDPATYKPYKPESVADLLKFFDEAVVNCARVLENVGDAALAKTWRLKMKGRTLVEKNKADVFRDFTLSHLIHHRGQFSVYLRLLDAAVPGSYGPTADEKF
jgi:uncharacterized damage-inducible protein DinB